MNPSTVILLLSFVLCAQGHHEEKPLSYSDLLALNMSCPQDRCSTMQNMTFFDRHCECDNDCVVFGDCCLDAPQRTSLGHNKIMQLSCMAFGYDELSLGAYVVGRCDPKYSVPPLVERNCHYFVGHKDPLLSVPVTDISSHVTYRNRYCARCNGVTSESLQSWWIYVSCDTLESADESITWQKLRYDADIGKWGVPYEGHFHTCKLLFDLPSYLSRYVRFCRPAVISSCAGDWTLLNVTQYCDSYMAVVYAESHVFRNMHCAMCNRQSLDNIYCNSGITAKRKPFSFAMLLDINTSNGDKVGQSSQCSSEEKYDPFFKKCRTLRCALPGFSKRNGRCVQD